MSQSAPQPNGGRPLWDQVIEDMHGRDTFGIERYRVPLQTGNGRDFAQDAYEESLDKTVYLKGLVIEHRALRETCTRQALEIILLREALRQANLRLRSGEQEAINFLISKCPNCANPQHEGDCTGHVSGGYGEVYDVLKEVMPTEGGIDTKPTTSVASGAVRQESPAAPEQTSAEGPSDTEMLDFAIHKLMIVDDWQRLCDRDAIRAAMQKENPDGK